MKMKSKKLLSLLLAMTMLLSTVPFTVSAAEEMVTDEPTVSLVASDVVRVAEAVGSMAKGSVIVKATPSGVPEISGNYTLEAYAGETPVSAQVTFSTNIDVTDVAIICTNNDTVILESSNPENNTYVWSVTGGIAEAGSYLDFEVSYKYNGKSYIALASSYVEGIIQPAGFYIDTHRGSSWYSGTYLDCVYRILGKNTYGGYYQLGDDKGDEFEQDTTVFSHGYYDFINIIATSWGYDAEKSEGYGLILWGSDNSSENHYANTTLDRQRPVSTTYIDSSEGTALNGENIALRYVVFDSSLSRDGDNNIRKLTDKTIVLPGQVEWSAESVNDETASTQLGFAAMGEDVIWLQDNGAFSKSSYSLSHWSISVPFNGTDYTDAMTKLDDGTREIYYTFVTNFYYLNTNTNRTITDYTATNIHLVMYDKGELKNQIAETEDFLAPSAATFSTDSVENMTGYNQFIDALKEAQHTAAKPNLYQADIDSAYEELVDATEKLGKEFWIEAEVVETTDTTSTVEVTVLGDVTKIRFVDPEGGTFTFNPDDTLVNSVTDLGNGIVKWSVNVPIYQAEETYSVYAKLNETGWNTEYTTVTITERAPDTSLKSVDIKDDLDGVIYYGVNELTVETGLDVTKVQLYKNGNTWTYTSDRATVTEENGVKVWTLKMNFSELGDQTFYIRTRSRKTAFEIADILDVTVYAK